MLIQCRTVGDDQHSGVINIFANPLGQPNHGQAFPRTLGVPDDSTLAPVYEWLGSLNPEVLIGPTKFLDPCIEDNEVVNDFQKPGLIADLRQVSIKPVVDLAVFFPSQIVLFRRLNRSVTQTLRVVARHHQLHRREKPFDVFLLLIEQVLTDAGCNIIDRPLKLDHSQGNAVNVQHDVGSFGMVADNGDFFGDSKVVLLRLFPIDQPHILLGFAGSLTDFHPVSEQSVELLVGFVEGFTLVTSDSLNVENCF